MGGIGGCPLGGILELSRLSVAHRSELYADFREFFHTSPTDLSGAQFIALVRALLQDPRSRFQAKTAGWRYPASRETLTTLHLIDILLQRWTEEGKYRPAERPWDPTRTPVKRRTPTEALRILRPHLFADHP